MQEKTFRVKWNPQVRQDVDSLTKTNSPFYDKVIHEQILDRYGSVENYLLDNTKLKYDLVDLMDENLEIYTGVDSSNKTKIQIIGQTDVVIKFLEKSNSIMVELLNWLLKNGYEKQQDGDNYWFNKDDKDYTAEELAREFQLETQTTYQK